MGQTASRRQFLRRAGVAVGALTWGAAGRAWSQSSSATATNPTTAPTTAPRSSIAIGVIGCGRRGRLDLKTALAQPGVRCAAICDVDARHLRRAQADVERIHGTTPEAYRDYRELLDRQAIDAVIIATPDHWHALIVVAALQMGKDIYCETPLTHNVVEGRRVLAAAADSDRIMQVGAATRSNPHIAEAIDMIQRGELGPIARTATLTASDDRAEQPVPRTPDADPPPELDYDLWLGPAPQRPYNEKRCHQTWRWFFDYGGGPTTERHVELLDVTQRALRQPGPTAVSASGGTLVLDDMRESFDTLEATCTYADCAHRSAISCLGPQVGGQDEGAYFEGARGRLIITAVGYRLLRPAKHNGDASQDVVHIRREEPQVTHARHMADFFACVRSRRKPVGDVVGLHQAGATAHLTKCALRLGRGLRWDASAGRCVAPDGSPDAAANQLLGRAYRSPWKLPNA